MNNDTHIIGVGSPLIDFLAHVPESFLANISGEKGGMELVDHEEIDEIIKIEQGEHRIAKASGGSAANTILGLSKLGMDCTFLGKIGRDSLGEFYTSVFAESGVRTDGFKYCDESPTGRCLSVITPDSQRTCRTYLGAAMNLTPDCVSVADFAHCTHAHVEGYLLFNQSLIYKVLESAKSANCTISLDLASFEVVRGNRESLDEIIENYVDFVFANEDESREFCGSSDCIEGVKELGKLCHLAAVKSGADGAVIKRDDEIVQVGTEKVHAVDTTGAGDLWAAGFLFGYFSGWDLEACGNAGAMLGAAVVQQTGAMIADDQWDEINKRLHSDSKD